MKLSLTLLSFLSLAGYSQSGWAVQQTLPKWEFGLGPALISYPDYPGSSEQNNLILPFPYIVYRGKDFTINQREVKKPLYEYQNVELDLSLSGTIPISSKDNQARKGMTDLDGSVGIGPVIRYRLYRKDLNEIKLEWPVRWILASDFRSIHEEGFISSPGLYYYLRKSYTAKRRIKLTLATTANFATAKTNDYFYGVDPTEATATRPAYQATGGFSGFGYLISLNWHLDDFWIGGFYKLTDLSQAVFRSSPLIETTRSEVYGLTLTWNFYRSKETVEGLE
ncbi:MAG: MipA/OmpV family protein [Hydrogenovibrio sp.]|nr:MipA/OmpV family protein [Hydrogenovibrio sp.]